MVWQVYQSNQKYFGTHPNSEIVRFQNLKSNWESLINLGLISKGEPYPSYKADTWDDVLQTLEKFEEAMARYHAGLEPLEETMSPDVFPPTSDSDPGSPPCPSKSPKNKKGKSLRKKQVKQVVRVKPEPQEATCSKYLEPERESHGGHHSRYREIDYAKIDDPDDIVLGSTAPEMRLTAKYPYWREDIAKLLSTGSAIPFIAEGPFDLRKIKLPSEGESESELDEDLKSVMEQYCGAVDEYDNVDAHTYFEMFDKIYNDSQRIHISSDEEEDEEKDHVEIPMTPLPKRPVTISPKSIVATSPKSPMTTTKISEDDGAGVIVECSRDISTLSDPDKDFELLGRLTDEDLEKLDEEHLKRNGTPGMIKLDNSYFSVLFEDESTRKRLTAGLEDIFKDISSVNDTNVISVGRVTKTQENVNQTVKDNVKSVKNNVKTVNSNVESTKNSFTNVDKRATLAEDQDLEGFEGTLTPQQSNNIRRNPKRNARKDVSYKELVDEDDDLIEYFCWGCKDFVYEICKTHGDLIPCMENVNAMGRKDPKDFPVPSFVKLKESNIPDAGTGAFATMFIPPGHVIGSYKGKIIDEKEYKKLESSKKESGYAWKVRFNDTIKYIDGGSYKSSNWLRFINCSRGQCEENLMVRIFKGTQLQYYTFKPVAIGAEFLVYYGDEYLKEMGYEVSMIDNKPGEYPCRKKCYRLFKTQEELDLHFCEKPTKQPKKYPCDRCGKSFQSNHYMKLHIKTVHDRIKDIECKQCGKMFGEHSSLIRHIKFVHEKIAKTFVCTFCNYRTNQKSSFKSHCKIHSGDVLTCKYCTYTCHTKQHLKSHVNNKHKFVKFKCTRKCGLSFDSEEELFAHIRTSHPIKRHTCKLCPMSYDSLQQLNQHLVSKHDDKTVPQHACQYCGKTFVFIHNLKKHSRIHTGAGPKFPCEVCGKEFSESSSLSKHKLIHTGERSFQCEFCKRAFTLICHLKQHKLSCKLNPDYELYQVL